MFLYNILFYMGHFKMIKQNDKTRHPNDKTRHPYMSCFCYLK